MGLELLALASAERAALRDGSVPGVAASTPGGAAESFAEIVGRLAVEASPPPSHVEGAAARPTCADAPKPGANETEVPPADPALTAVVATVVPLLAQTLPVPEVGAWGKRAVGDDEFDGGAVRTARPPAAPEDDKTAMALAAATSVSPSIAAAAVAAVAATVVPSPAPAPPVPSVGDSARRAAGGEEPEAGAAEAPVLSEALPDDTPAMALAAASSVPTSIAAAAIAPFTPAVAEATPGALLGDIAPPKAAGDAAGADGATRSVRSQTGPPTSAEEAYPAARIAPAALPGARPAQAPGAASGPEAVSPTVPQSPDSAVTTGREVVSAPRGPTGLEVAGGVPRLAASSPAVDSPAGRREAADPALRAALNELQRVLTTTVPDVRGAGTFLADAAGEARQSASPSPGTPASPPSPAAAGIGLASPAAAGEARPADTATTRARIAFESAVNSTAGPVMWRLSDLADSDGQSTSGRQTPARFSPRAALDLKVPSDPTAAAPPVTITQATVPPETLAGTGGGTVAIAGPSPRPDAPGPEVPEQIVRAIRMQWRDGLGEARLRLQPEHLGQVSISLKVDGQAVTAVVRTETAAAQMTIQLNQLDLRSALAAHGLNLDHLVVEVDPDARRGQQRPPPEVPRRPRRRDPSDGEPLFEVTV